MSFNKLCLGLLIMTLLNSGAHATLYNVRDYGALGDGRTTDTAAINSALQAASAAGGGTVYFPAGDYLSFSIRLASNITLHLDSGAVLRAANPRDHGGAYDPAEPNEFDDYQDFGHSHWQNSLIWGENLHNIAIVGPGLIDGTDALSRGRVRAGDANKAIALKRCRNVTFRDFSILNGGHFAIIGTGVDNWTIDGLRIDTNRDGIDVDCCKNVRISNTSINSPNDDALVLKSSYALGEARPCENITITNCQLTGYDLGTLLDGTYGRTTQAAPDRDGPTGRIKFGTESNGGFRNITISNCVFDRCRGLALETVDGGIIDNIAISNLVMRDIVNSPFFIRLGNRARGPEGTPVGAIRGVSISNVVVQDADSRYASSITGLPGHPVEDITLSNIRIQYKGGLTMEQVAEQPDDLVNRFFLRTRDEEGVTGPREPFAVPERENAYPEPSMFGLLPAYGFYVRHARNIRLSDVEIGFIEEDTRPAVTLEDVEGVAFHDFRAQTGPGAPVFALRDVRDFKTRGVDRVEDGVIESADRRQLPAE